MPTLHPLCTDHAVICARRPRILGNAAPRATVTVELAGHRAETVADEEGGWKLELPPLPPGGPHVLVARDAGGEAVARDILLGEVWLGGGQSNMEWTLAQTKDCAPDISAAQEPLLRVFTVARARQVSGPPARLTGGWSLCTPEAAPGFGAVAYFFGRKLVAETGRPCGMIVSAWGGSPIAAWLPEELLSSRPEYAPFVAALAAGRANPPRPEDFAEHQDPGIAAHAASWPSPGYDDSAWPTLRVPGYWQNAGWIFNGAVWYRRTVSIPAAWVGRDLELRLGVVDDFDQTFVNGSLVGANGRERDGWWAFKRTYLVPAALVTSRRVCVAVRVFDIFGNGGMVGEPSLRPVDAPGADALELVGDWRAKAELELPQRSAGGPPLEPSCLWNGMIRPLLGVGLSGFLWYQGESDVDRAALYQRLLADLIASWRRAFAAPELPFGIVQLANYQQRSSTPVEAPWAELREAQRLVALHTPACGLASAIDLGEAEDIHPRHKRQVGERLALWALRQVHGRADLPYSGPLPVECWRETDGLRVRFAHADGLRVRGDGLRGFALRGADGRWVWADEAEVSGDTVFVRAASAPAPLAVRYAWQSNPETCLENGSGLPASSFQLSPRQIP